MEKLRFFEEPGIGAMCFLTGKKGAEDYLEIDEQGIISLPEGFVPGGFYLVLAFPKEARVVIGQRDLSRHHGKYFSYALAPLEGLLGPDYNVWVLNNPIRVKRAGKEVWLPWKGGPYEPSNKVDCWIVGDDGNVDLFQVGIVTHDNGKSFHLLGEYRWRGRLFYGKNGEMVGKPADPRWGSFEARKEILDNQDFRRALPKLSVRRSQVKLDYPLGKIPKERHARVQWYSPFAGQTGQGPVICYDNSSAWIHGADIVDPPDPDGIHRLQRNDLIRYAGTATFGEKTPQTKLLCVSKVH